MPRIYLRLILIPTILFTAVLLIIHAQPYDDHELRQLLLPEGCPAPCIMGIRPEVTTVDEAVTLLEASGWAKNIKRSNNDAGKLSKIEWNWNNKAPTILNSQIKNELVPVYLETNAPPLIEKITIETTVPIFDIYLLLGEPDATDSTPGFTAENMAYVLALYLKNDSFITSRVNCPVSKESFLNSRATITLMSDSFIRQMTGYSSIDHYC